MKNEEIIRYLEEKPSQLDFKGLIDFIKETDFTFKSETLISSVGVATLDCILIDFNKLSKYSDSVCFFIILHEIGHYKRILKLGRKEIIKNFSLMDFREFNDSIINEEIIADRYASMLFLKFNGFPYPRLLTQQLEDEYYRSMYALKTAKYFGIVKNSEENYYKLIKQFVL